MEAGVSTAPPIADPRWRPRHDEGPALRMEDADTAEVVGRIQEGHSTHFDRLYERYFDRVYGYLKVMLRDSHEAEDAAQQTFIQVLEALPRYEPRTAPFRAWLFRIARNEGLMRLRKRGRIDVSEPEAIERRMNGSSDTEAMDPGAVREASFANLIERLPEAQRQVLVLRYMLDLPPKEIATVIGRSHGAVRKLHHRAMRTLEAELEGDERVPRAARRARAPMLVRLRRVPVIRARRFALLGPGSGRAAGFTPASAFSSAPRTTPALGRQPYRN